MGEVMHHFTLLGGAVPGYPDINVGFVASITLAHPLYTDVISRGIGTWSEGPPQFVSSAPAATPEPVAITRPGTGPTTGAELVEMGKAALVRLAKKVKAAFDVKMNEAELAATIATHLGPSALENEDVKAALAKAASKSEKSEPKAASKSDGKSETGDDTNHDDDTADADADA